MALPPEKTSGQWGQVFNDKIGFFSSSVKKSSFEKTELLERRLSALTAQREKIDAEIEARRKEKKSGGGGGRGGGGSERRSESAERRRKVQLCLDFQYQSEASRQFVDHNKKNLIMNTLPVTREIRGNNKLGTEPPRAKFSAQGEFVDWVDVASAEGGLVPVVAAERLGITRMKR